MKSLVRGLARRLGYDIVSRRGIPPDPIPPWTVTAAARAAGPLRDDLIAEGWISAALNVATRAYRPDPLTYRRQRQGEDPRIKHLALFLDPRGLRTLELGPHEGFWSILLEKMGVAENVAIESRPENLARCERVRDLHRLTRTRFVAGDIEALANGRAALDLGAPFDLVFCLGLLYHLPEPARALRWCRSQAPRLFLGTHYVEPGEPGRYLAANFSDADHHFEGRTFRGKTYREGGLADPLSGMSPTSFWPFEADLIAMIRAAGYTRVDVLGKDLANRMPHITVLAE